jgi:hypothetical protein
MVKEVKFFRKQAEKAERMARASTMKSRRKVLQIWPWRIAVRPTC